MAEAARACMTGTEMASLAWCSRSEEVAGAVVLVLEVGILVFGGVELVGEVLVLMWEGGEGKTEGILVVTVTGGKGEGGGGGRCKVSIQAGKLLTWRGQGAGGVNFGWLRKIGKVASFSSQARKV